MAPRQNQIRPGTTHTCWPFGLLKACVMTSAQTDSDPRAQGFKFLLWTDALWKACPLAKARLAVRTFPRNYFDSKASLFQSISLWLYCGIVSILVSILGGNCLETESNVSQGPTRLLGVNLDHKPVWSVAHRHGMRGLTNCRQNDC